MRSIICFLLLQSVAFAQSKIPTIERIETGKVTAVTDGDTVRVLIGKTELRVRLEGIDAPESKQAFGTRSKQHLSELVFGKEIDVHVTGTDRYGRALARLRLDGIDINLRMIRDGFAWHYAVYNAEPAYADAQTEAKVAKRGLWADESPVPPWEFRKKKQQSR